MAIYITSDLHFCHNQPFVYEPRGFQSVEKMNIEIVNRINEVVKPEDELWILGDLMLNDTAVGIQYMQLLHGKIHLILGNHDTNNRIALYRERLPNMIIEGFGARLKYQGYNFYLSHYPSLVENFDREEPLKHQVINLCGHSHTQNWAQDLDKGLIFHCEVDTNNCYPWNLDEIINIMKGIHEDTIKVRCWK